MLRGLAGRAAKAAAPESHVRIDEKPDKPKDPVEQDVTVIKGVKGATQGKLAKLGLETVRDLLYLFPNRHNDFGDVRPIAELVPEEDQTALVTVWSASIVRLGRRPGTQAVVGDESGTMRVVWFNQPYLADQLHTNDKIVVAGKVGLFNRNKTMENPEWERVGANEDLTHTGRLVPVYPLTQGLSQRVLRRVAKEAVDRFAEALKEPLPKDIRQRHKLPDLPKAVRQMHYPDSMERVRGRPPPHRLRGAVLRAARHAGAPPGLAGRQRGADGLGGRAGGVPRVAAVRADRRAGARARRDHRRPQALAAHGAAAARRRGFGQDGCRRRGARDCRGEPVPGRADGPDRDPGGAALQDAVGSARQDSKSRAGVSTCSSSPARRALPRSCASRTASHPARSTSSWARTR